MAKFGFLEGFQFKKDRMCKDDEICEELIDGIKFDNVNFTLRYINEDDLKMDKRDEYEINYFTFYPHLYNKCMIEYNKNDYSILPNILTFCNSLRIIKKGDVHCINIFMDDMHIISQKTYNITKPYVLYKKDVDIVNKITYNMNRLRKNDYFNTAILYFDEAYERVYGRIGPEKLMDALISAEALFIDDKNYRYTGSVIGLACSHLIGNNEKERNNIKKDFEIAYSIRNKLMHGRGFTKFKKDAQKEWNNLDDFNDRIMSYLRRSLYKLCI